MKFTIGNVSGLRPDVPGCTGKVKYNSKGAAEAAIRSLKRKHTVKSPELLNSYLCSCHFWHVGRAKGKTSG